MLSLPYISKTTVTKGWLLLHILLKLKIGNYFDNKLEQENSMLLWLVQRPRDNKLSKFSNTFDFETFIRVNGQNVYCCLLEETQALMINDFEG